MSHINKLLEFHHVDIFDKSASEDFYILEYLRITNKMFKWTGLPDSIPERILEHYLQTKGIIACTKDNAGELRVFFGGYGDEPDIYYEPTKFIISNPLFQKTCTIGEDCVVLRNDSALQGLLPLYSRYARLMLENDISIYDAEINMRIQSLISASDDKTRASAELYLKRVEEGKPGIIAQSGFLDDALSTKPFATAGTTNGLSQLIEMHQYLKGSLLNEIGLNANYNMKRERINSAESELNNDGLLPFVEDMLQCRIEACEAINAMFGTNISVDLNSSWKIRKEEAEEGGNEDAANDIKGSNSGESGEPVPEGDGE